jgi:hypothetical protein
MKIGGHDQVLQISPTPEDEREIFRAARIAWPRMEIVRVSSEEVLIYSFPGSQGFVHVLIRPETLTFVYEPGVETAWVSRVAEEILRRHTAQNTKPALDWNALRDDLHARLRKEEENQRLRAAQEMETARLLREHAQKTARATVERDLPAAIETWVAAKAAGEARALLYEAEVWNDQTKELAQAWGEAAARLRIEIESEVNAEGTGGRLYVKIP